MCDLQMTPLYLDFENEFKSVAKQMTDMGLRKNDRYVFFHNLNRLETIVVIFALDALA